MQPTRIPSTAIRPGHTVALEYGRDITITVDDVHVEEQWVRLCGHVAVPGAEAHEHTTDSRHSLARRLLVIADGNEPPAGNPSWNDLDRVVRRWTDGYCDVWSLDDPDEPVGHGGVYRGRVETDTYGCWTWQAAYLDAHGVHGGDYLTAERALLDATNTTVNA